MRPENPVVTLLPCRCEEKLGSTCELGSLRKGPSAIFSGGGMLCKLDNTAEHVRAFKKWHS